jgi:ABC-type uncharacterized transport system YnjBCD substrate-binding protein
MSLPAAPLRLAPKARTRFDARTLGPVLPEPHASWMVKIAEDRAERDGLPK